MIVFLGLQSLVFAAWAVVSFGILFGVASRALGHASGFPATARQEDAVRGYLSDPMTALRRRIWLILTALLFACTLVSGVMFLRL